MYVAALGASTPVGRDAWSSAAAVRAGISGFTAHPYMLDTVGEPVRLALAPWLEPECEGVARFAGLLRPAIQQAWMEREPPHQLRIALALALPTPRPGLPDDLQRALQEFITSEFPGRFSVVAGFPTGHAAGLIALRAAARKIAAGELDGCVLAGVDTYLSPETLEWLEETDQLHGAGALNNAWGFVPGEAAGAVLVLGRRAVERLDIKPLSEVLGVGVGVERNRIRTETVCIGEGLTEAFRDGLAALPAGARVTDVFCDMNGEPYRADEFGFACLRTREAFVAASDFVAPADCWGDVGAAGAALHVMLASIAGFKQYGRGSHALVWGSSDTGERGAALLSVTPGH
jgi:3-oxoacyl-[acyl-carrier-protein] synthase-1